MKYDPDKHHRRSIRLKGYDYSQAGAYFVTVCARERACLFGDITDGHMVLNDAGRMVEKWWTECNRGFPAIQTDEYIVMPNHFHGIIVITTTVGADLCVCPDQTTGAHIGAPLPSPGAHTVPQTETGAHIGAPLPSPGAHAVPQTETGAHIGAPLPEIIQWFKTMTTNEYIRGVKIKGWHPFRGRLWQRNYYEHIIRNDEALNRIREYIANNPPQWMHDRENPGIVTPGSGDLAVTPTKDGAWRV